MLQRTKTILWGGGAILLFIGLIVAIVVFRRPTILSPESSSSSIQTPAQALSDKTISAILDGADPTMCREAGDREAVDRCFSVVAASRHNEELCGEIGAREHQVRCREFAVVARVQTGGDPDDCLSITDSDIRDACVVQAVNLDATEIYCSGFSGDTQILCLDRVRMARSLAGDREACAGIIAEDLREECYAPDASPESTDTEVSQTSDADGDGLTDDEELQFGSRGDRTDTDGDGLTDFVEVRTYRTDPTDNDSDKDGFGDGTEVSNGYNPLGPGRLQ